MSHAAATPTPAPAPNAGPDELGKLLDEAEAFVREHPWQALAMAAGAGLVLGLLLGKR